MRLVRTPQFLIAAPLLAALLVAAALPSFVPTLDPLACDLSESLLRPSGDHPFGTSLQGCDYLAETLYGTRASLSIAAIVVAAAAVIAMVLGGVAGYLGGWWDVVIARATDAWFAIPLILGGLVVLSFMDERGVLTVAVVLSIFGWPTMTRLVRASVRSVRELEFVAASEALGASRTHVLVRHVLPNAMRPLLVYASAYAGVVIAVEATLSYLGVGLQMPTVSWGILLYEAQFRVREAPHLIVFPTIFLVGAVLSFVLLGEGLRRVWDPRSTT